MPEGIGHQFAGEQGRDGSIDGNIPGADGRADLVAGGLRGVLGGQRDAQLARRGRTGERPRVHGGFLTGLREPGPGWHDPRWAAGPHGRSGQALPDTRSCCCNTNTDASCSERHRSADGSLPAAALTSRPAPVSPHRDLSSQRGARRPRWRRSRGRGGRSRAAAASRGCSRGWPGRGCWRIERQWKRPCPGLGINS